MKVFCRVEGVYQGVRNLASFKPEVSNAWCKSGEFFPVYDEETFEIFECGFNAKTGWIIAYREVSMQEFRQRLEKEAQRLIAMQIEEAMQRAKDEASALLKEAWYFGIE